MSIAHDPAALHILRVSILRFFLSEAKQTGDLIAHPDVKGFATRSVRNLIYAMELSGLLDKRGTTSGAWYMTTRLGYIVLVTLSENLPDKPSHPHTDKV